ncbi:hypothetical protein NDU88_005263 [Pleurodeles waltl]|uniref:GAGE domain-containing protein n=1 Tax=Pleurodeles waltl TaxID=8319 RepID=A0AAV7LKN6_PLEWA|nr:hypothetical protein NDU88_005263 [Pleurodeles waltl]
MRTREGPDVKEVLDPLEEQVASLIPAELVAGVEGQDRAEVEDQQELQEGQTTSPGEQLVCDTQLFKDTMLSPMDEDTFQQPLDTFEASPLVLAKEENIVGYPDEPTQI